MELNRDFYEFFASLIEHDVRFLVIGGYPPERIDLLTTPSGVTFEDCWRDSMTVAVGGLDIPVLGRTD
jgi:hypothetical protein